MSQHKAKSRFYRSLLRHSDKNSAAINNRCLDSLVRDNHVDNNRKENFVYVYFGSIVNDRHKIRICKKQRLPSLCVFLSFTKVILRFLSKKKKKKKKKKEKERIRMIINSFTATGDNNRLLQTA